MYDWFGSFTTAGYNTVALISLALLAFVTSSQLVPHCEPTFVRFTQAALDLGVSVLTYVKESPGKALVRLVLFFAVSGALVFSLWSVISVVKGKKSTALKVKGLEG